MPTALAAREERIPSGMLDYLSGKFTQLAGAGRNIVGGATQWLGPGTPISPVAPPEVRVRRLYYPVGYNYNVDPRPYEGFSFFQLQQVANRCDLVRIAIEMRKKQVKRLPWQFRIKQNPGMSARDVRKATLGDQRIKALTDLFNSPDREHSFRQWINLLLENLMVLDAACILPRFTIAGKIYGFDVIEGSTISRKIDPQGRTPLPPQPAYQQQLNGIPSRNLIAPDPKLWNLTDSDDNGNTWPVEQILYYMSNPRPGYIYGFSRVEAIMLAIEILLRRELAQLEYYTEGGRPDVFAELPEEWAASTERISEFQAYWDALFTGTAVRRRVRFVPGGTKLEFSKQEILKDQYDEWLWMVIAANFDLPKTAFVRQTNRATSDRESNDMEEQGVESDAADLETIINRLVWTYFGYSDIEFVFGESKEADALKQAQVFDLKVRNGSMTIDEAREEDGREPRDLDDYIPTASGLVPIDEGMSASGEHQGDEGSREMENPGIKPKALKKKAWNSEPRQPTLSAAPDWDEY